MDRAAMAQVDVRRESLSGGHTPAGANPCLMQAVQALAEAEQAVRSGSAAGLFEAAGFLESAVEACRQYGSNGAGLPSGERKLDAEHLSAIRGRLQRIGALMAQSAEFHAGWARLAGSRASAYGPDGAELGLPSGSAAGSRCDASG